MTSVDVEKLSFAYGESDPVVDCVSLSVRGGEICALVGASGSGKSTLLKVIAGILPNAPGQYIKGRVEILGQPPAESALLGQVGYVFQDFKILPFLTVEENIRWALRRIGQTRATKIENPQAEVERLLLLVGLRDCRSRLPRALSGGMKARVALARALAGSPQVLLVDEAFASLDVGWRISLYAELRRLCDVMRVACIVISHDLVEVSEIADKFIVLSPTGRVAGDIGPGQSASQTAVELRQLVLRDHPARGG